MAQSDVREFETGTGVMQEEGSFFTGTRTAQSRERTFVTYNPNLSFAGYSTLNYGYGRYGDSESIFTAGSFVKVYDGTGFVEKPLMIKKDGTFEHVSALQVGGWI